MALLDSAAIARANAQRDDSEHRRQRQRKLQRDLETQPIAFGEREEIRGEPDAYAREALMPRYEGHLAGLLAQAEIKRRAAEREKGG